MQQSIMVARVGFVKKVKEVWNSDEPRVSIRREPLGGGALVRCCVLVAMTAGGGGGGSACGQLLGCPRGPAECAETEEVGGATMVAVRGVTPSLAPVGGCGALTCAQ